MGLAADGTLLPKLMCACLFLQSEGEGREPSLCFCNLALSLSFIHSISSCAVLTVGEALCLGLTSRSKLVGQGPRSSWSSRSSWEDRQ